MSWSPRRSPWVIPTLLVLLVGLPILEVWLLIRVGHAIGGLNTVAILIVEALFGGWLMRREGSRAWRSLLEAVRRGSLPVDEATDAVLVLIGGVLLVLPGFVTDVVGLVFLLPFTRPVARRLVTVLVARRARGLTGTFNVTRSRINVDGETIEGEVVEGHVDDDGSERPRELGG
ncbi:MAG: FxsA family protein [Propionibacterium sp.]|nr:FxsA family protein [Propionibacterium sp.]